MRYYLDTCIWRDFLENRRDNSGKPIGHYAFLLIQKLMREKATILFSPLLLRELQGEYSLDEIKSLFLLFQMSGLGRSVSMSDKQLREAESLSHDHVNDALHAILARDNQAILITRDNDFNDFKKIVTIKKPEEL